ncbi:MAG: GSCFA domain-containing protein [Candidatus Sericytochromatia bacterium]
MSDAVFPYAQLAPWQRWDQAPPLGTPAGGPAPRFAWTRQTRIGTLGSCFARHIAQTLREQGFHWLEQEPAPPFLSPEDQIAQGYGLYSARYGEIYNPLQLEQLLLRALGEFTPQESPWQRPDGRWVDPFRPRQEPAGWESPEAVWAAQARHLQAVRQLFCAAEALVVTLGLVEIWRCRSDGAVLPVCPGKAFGHFDPDHYRFERLSLECTLQALERFLKRLRALNPEVQVLLTVSPVPLAATLLPQHVRRASLLAKSTLLLASESLCQRWPDVDYYPSYEQIMADPVGQFMPDGRSVRPEAVAQVMQRFLAWVAPTEAWSAPVVPAAAPVPSAPLACDEEQLLYTLAQAFEAP